MFYHICGIFIPYAGSPFESAAAAAGLLLHESCGPAPSAGPGGATKHRSLEPVEGAWTPGARGAVPVGSERPPEVFRAQPEVSSLRGSAWDRCENRGGCSADCTIPQEN